MHIGRLCDLGTSADAGQVTVLTNTGALECPSRICILPSQERGTNTVALCTAECENDDDCSDGELRSREMNTNDRRCRDGFTCRTLLNGVQGNELACKRLCVCRDFVRTGDTTGGNTQNCNGTMPIR
jgi:hypothetical protein